MLLTTNVCNLGESLPRAFYRCSDISIYAHFDQDVDTQNVLKDPTLK